MIVKIDAFAMIFGWVVTVIKGGPMSKQLA